LLSKKNGKEGIKNEEKGHSRPKGSIKAWNLERPLDSEKSLKFCRCSCFKFILNLRFSPTGSKYGLTDYE
jgi:hypothetical protein